MKAQAKGVKDGSTPASLAAAFAKCDAIFAKKWTAAEKRGGAVCPTIGDAGPLQARAFDFAHFAALSLAPARFIDNGDGTVTDTRTGLQWEQKEDADGEANYGNPHDVDSTYLERDRDRARRHRLHAVPRRAEHLCQSLRQRRVRRPLRLAPAVDLRQ
ncbi:MAG: hypothetical protein U0802_09040 [Candidatus Binatia bacterium]